MAKYTVSLRGGFSDRNKIKEENTAIQTCAFDVRTRIALCNATYVVVSYGVINNNMLYDWAVQNFVKHIHSDVYGHVVEWDKSYPTRSTLDMLLSTIHSDEYDAVLTVVEYVAQEVDKLTPHGFLFESNRHKASDFYNKVFEQEYVGYRFVNGYIVPITDSAELSEIKEAVSSNYDAVREHIDKAVRFLSDRNTPDYANSIKESISSVERMCSIIVGKSTRLGDALKLLEKKGISIHPQLVVAFEKLYSYTNGASGIRHAGQLGGEDSTFEEAKFMLVSCCAFVNYLTGLMAKCQ